MHLPGDGADSLQPIDTQMFATLHQQNDASKLLEVDALPRFQRVLDEEWNDARAQLLQPADAVSHLFAMILADDPTPEVSLQRMQELHIAFMLHDGELRQNLIAVDHIGMLRNPDVETAFTVHETYDPFRLKLHWPAPDVLVSEGSRGSRESSLRIVPLSNGLFLPA